jgi:4-hydroxy-tetrahydrodipicolinate synthase
MPETYEPRSPYTGIWVPMITPFKHGDVDYDAANLFAHHLVDAGVHGLVVGGTTGEGPSLTPYEKARLVEAVAASVPDDIPVVLGVEGANTQKILNELAEIGDLPVHGYLVSAPSYVRPGQEGIYRHFMAISEAVKRPVILYDIPARTGAVLHIDTILRLMASGDFPAIKACGLTTERLKDLLAIYRLKVMCGDDPWMFRALEMGAHGVISASAQVAPRRFVEAYAMLEKYSADGAWKRFNILMPLIEHMFAQPNPASVKAALALQTWCQEELRLPMTPVTADFRQELETVLANMHALHHDDLICADKSSK